MMVMMMMMMMTTQIFESTQTLVHVLKRETGSLKLRTDAIKGPSAPPPASMAEVEALRRQQRELGMDDTSRMPHGFARGPNAPPPPPPPPEAFHLSSATHTPQKMKSHKFELSRQPTVKPRQSPGEGQSSHFLRFSPLPHQFGGSLAACVNPSLRSSLVFACISSFPPLLLRAIEFQFVARIPSFPYCLCSVMSRARGCGHASSSGARELSTTVVPLRSDTIAVVASVHSLAHLRC
eukprot:GHVU01219338.1.p1 GENE.GHVU01219338.1~~GHVU01219338.1.p1  ORF type:complete len:236 (-),score=16.91 GHVU01219338.1:119-826(-)